MGDPNARLARARNLLGLTGVINQVRLIFDRTPTLAAQCGVLVVEKKEPSSVLKVGLEPTPSCEDRILSPVRLPSV